jgi:hypothetical protein
VSCSQGLYRAGAQGEYSRDRRTHTRPVHSRARKLAAFQQVWQQVTATRIGTGARNCAGMDALTRQDALSSTQPVGAHNLQNKVSTSIADSWQGHAMALRGGATWTQPASGRHGWLRSGVGGWAWDRCGGDRMVCWAGCEESGALARERRCRRQGGEGAAAGTD